MAAQQSSAEADQTLIQLSLEIQRLQRGFEDQTIPDPSDDELGADVVRQCALIQQLCETPSRSRLGLMCKVRVLCAEMGVHPCFPWQIAQPTTLTEAVLLSLAADILWGDDHVAYVYPPAA